MTAVFSLCPGSQSGKGRLGSLGSSKRRHHQEEKRSWHDRLEHGLCAASRWSPREEARPQGEGSMVPFWKLGPRLLAPSLSEVFCAPRQPQNSRVPTLKGMMQNEITSCNRWQMIRRPPPWALALHKPTDQDQPRGDAPVVTETELPVVPWDRTSDAIKKIRKCDILAHLNLWIPHRTRRGQKESPRG